jgi:2'-5' RNA ligase
LSFRAFVSIDIDPDERLARLLSDLMGLGADLKVVRPELLHLTLKFLGDTEEGAVGDIVSRIEKSVSGVQPFSVRFVGMGAFPSLSNIRVVWVGIQDAEGLKTMAEKMDRLLEEQGFQRDRKGFRPHLTIARAKSSRNIRRVQNMIEERAATPYGEYRVIHVRLKKSVLSPQGPTYSTVREIGLSAE